MDDDFVDGARTSPPVFKENGSWHRRHNDDPLSLSLSRTHTFPRLRFSLCFIPLSAGWVCFLSHQPRQAGGQVSVCQMIAVRLFIFLYDCLSTLSKRPTRCSGLVAMATHPLNSRLSSLLFFCPGQQGIFIPKQFPPLFFQKNREKKDDQATIRQNDAPGPLINLRPMPTQASQLNTTRSSDNSNRILNTSKKIKLDETTVTSSRPRYG